MITDKPSLTEKYRGTGFKLTPQRLEIIRYLDGNKEHPCAEDIYRAVAKKFPTMSLATVYNTLDSLRERGEILQLTFDPVRKRFDPNTEPHHHLICVRCKKVVDVHNRYDLSLPGEYENGFKITGNHIEFYGLCPQCRD